LGKKDKINVNCRKYTNDNSRNRARKKNEKAKGYNDCLGWLVLGGGSVGGGGGGGGGGGRGGGGGGVVLCVRFGSLPFWLASEIANNHTYQTEK